MEQTILLGHGSGGMMSHQLINEIFYPNFKNQTVKEDFDAALLTIESSDIGFTTDSFVVDPLIFPGGDIGKLAVAGTVNDLIVCGIVPYYLSASFILEEGLETDLLLKIVQSMQKEAERAGVSIVTGDTKVVPKGKCDKLFVNTSGIGIRHPNYAAELAKKQIVKNDVILINGTIADHGIAVISAREDSIKTDIRSDVTNLNSMIKALLDEKLNIRFMRDATRGGIATVLCEVTEDKSFGIEIDEQKINVKREVEGICNLFGYDPLYVANEGKVVIIIDPDHADRALEIIRQFEEGKNSCIIGTITDNHHGKVVMNTRIGGKRVINMLAGEQFPRIC